MICSFARFKVGDLTRVGDFVRVDYLASLGDVGDFGEGYSGFFSSNKSFETSTVSSFFSSLTSSVCCGYSYPFKESFSTAGVASSSS